jgi:NADH-quinone oxidoreductase subunit M
MSTFPWLTVAGAIPLAGALVVAAVPSGDGERSRDQLIKQLSLGFTLTTLVVIAAMAVRFKPGGPTFQFTEITSWIPEFGVHYAVGVDGIALVLIVMTAILMPVVVLASWNDAEGGSSPEGEDPPKRSVKTYFCCCWCWKR